MLALLTRALCQGWYLYQKNTHTQKSQFADMIVFFFLAAPLMNVLMNSTAHVSCI